MQYNIDNTDLQEPIERARIALLGKYAKSSATFSDKNAINKGLESKSADTLYEHVNPETGELTTFKKNSFNDDLVKELTFAEIISERFLLQSCAGYLMPHKRVHNCNVYTNGSDVCVHKSKTSGTTSFSGVQTCGSVWDCALCAAKISERRKNEVVHALEEHSTSGGNLFFITLTFPHDRQDNLAVLKEKFSLALKFLRQSYDYRVLKQHVGYSGLIRALEVTYGEANGWHPHTHEILFCRNKVSFQSIKRLLFPIWKASCIKAGLKAPSFRRGLDVKGGDKAGEYITKYGYELTKSHIKKARGDRFSPFELLRSYFYENNKQHGAKYVEFCESMFGARQLYWTNGLKKSFGIDEVSDNELAERLEDDTSLMGKIPLDHWKAVNKYKARATVKLLAQFHGFDEVENFLENLYERYVTSGDEQKDIERRLKRQKQRAIKKEKDTHKSLAEKGIKKATQNCQSWWRIELNEERESTYKKHYNANIKPLIQKLE